MSNETLPTLLSDELANVIRLTVDGRAIYQCPTCSNPWEGEKMYDHVEKQAQKRILEKAIERLEDVSGEMEDASYEKAITAIKSLLAEIDT